MLSWLYLQFLRAILGQEGGSIIGAQPQLVKLARHFDNPRVVAFAHAAGEYVSRRDKRPQTPFAHAA